MTLTHGTEWLESARLVLRRIAPHDLPFFTRIHGLPEVAQHLYPGGRPPSPEETAAWLQIVLSAYEQLALGSLAVLRKDDGALIGRCGLMDLAVESAATEHGIRRAWFGRAQAAAGLALTFECELGYTFDPAVWGQGFATEAARCVRDYARDVLRLSYAISAILPQNSRSRRVAERSGARAAGQMDVAGVVWDRYLWPLATGGETRLQPVSPRWTRPRRIEPRKETTMATTLATWTIDPVHSSVEFSLDYMGFSTYRTGFRALEGALELDPARPASASVSASIPVASVDVTNDKLMSRLMDADLLGGKDHPTITFRSTRVDAVDAAQWKVTGDLTIHGVTRPVVLDTRYLGQAKHPFSGKIAAAFRAETAIDRRDFGVTWNAAMDTGAAYLGERVQISLSILAARQD